jgi:Lon protease-like protein
VITHVERLADGRYNIVLRGSNASGLLARKTASRTGARRFEPLAERPLATDERQVVRNTRARLEALLAATLRRAHPEAPDATPDLRTASAMCDEDLVNALAQYLDLEPLERQALLEHDSLRLRAESLVELLEMKLLIARTPGLSNVAH